MKEQKVYFFIAIVVFFIGCDMSPKSHEILSEEILFQQILDISKINSSSTQIDNETITKLTPISELPSQIHQFKIDFESKENGQSQLFGSIQYETEFQKFAINEYEFWLPIKWKSFGFGDSMKTKINAFPNYKLDFNSDSTLKISQYTYVILGGENSSFTLEDFDRKNGINALSVKSASGPISSNLIEIVFNSFNGELSQAEFSGKGNGFERDSLSEIYEDIFGGWNKIKGSYSFGFKK